MGVLLQAYYLRGKGVGVPSPFAGDAGAPPWWDHLARQAQEFAQAGFTAVWLPPVHKGDSGTQSVGFDMFDDYDIGSKNQKGTVPTRYGTREELQRCVAIMRANGLDVYLDLVENQRAGGSGPGGFTFRYAGAGGTAAKGRFPKSASNFHPNVPQDPAVFGSPSMKEISFGADLAPINGKPTGYVSQGLIDAADWLTRALDVQGYRLDDAKGVSTEFMPRLLNSKSLGGKFAVGEFFDGNVGLVQNWVFNPKGMNGRAAAFDFPLRFMLAQMCNRSAPFDLSLLDHAGLAGVAPFQAVTFVENHDTDVTPNLAPVVRNKMLGYAYILTSEGYPCVFYKDYSHDPGCYGLKAEIDNLIWIHEQLASGGTQQRWKEHDLFVYERLGGPHLLVGLNNSEGSRSVPVDTGFGPHLPLHDYTGHGPDIVTDGAGRVTLPVPPNRNGNGYVCYSREGRQGSGSHPARHPVTQVFEGAPDLDIGPAAEGAFAPAGRIWAGANSTIHTTLRFDSAGWSDATRLSLAIEGPDGAEITARSFGRAESGVGLSAGATRTGWHSLRIRADHGPAGPAGIPYSLSVTYTSAQGL